MKRWFGAVIVVVVLGCGQQQPQSGLRTVGSGMSVENPLEPIPFAEWSGSLWPEGEQVILLTGGRPEHEGEFLAYGIDVVNQQVAFTLYGDSATEYPELARRAAEEMASRAKGCGGFGGQVPIPLPAPPVPEGEPYEDLMKRASGLAALFCP